MDAIVARGLSKRFGDFEAVKGIDFAVAERECFGFLGPNGAGKTSTMRMIATAAPPSAGTIEILGMGANRGREIRARLGVVPQENNLDDEITVLENLVIYARYFGMSTRAARQKATDLLGFVELTEKRDWRVPQLSGGMKRRLLIARALLNDPAVLILDEPTTGLDPQARHLVWERLRALKSQGVTLVLTTHYMDEATQLCDRLVIMHEGRVLIEGPPRQLIAKELPPHVVEVFDASFELPARLSAIADHVERLTDRVLVYTHDGDGLLAKLRRQKVDPPGGVWLRAATLEDVFLSLTGRGLLE